MIYRWEPYARTEYAGRAYLARLPGGPLVELSGSAGLIVDHLADEMTAEEIVHRVAAATGLPAGRIRGDIVSLIGHLARLGFLQEQPCSAR